MKEKEKITQANFDICIIGETEKYNEVTSKARCRIFYKYANRNATYITDEFAEKLISTLSYTPIKGIYLKDDNDYTDHGADRHLGKIYGITPENPNCSWEEHEDEDGVMRTYLCCDVLLFTALYEEANDIFGKAQSMEIYPPSISGAWEIIDGVEYFVFKEGCFLGLQVLGEQVEPCFEGAAFFNLYNSLKEICGKIENTNFSNHEKTGGKETKMITFNIAQESKEKYSAIFSALNKNFNEENNFTVDYLVCSIAEDSIIVQNLEKGCYEKIENPESGEYFECLEKAEKIENLFVNDKDLENIKGVYEKNGNSYDNLVENTFTALDSNEVTINTLNDTIATYKADIEAKDISINDLTIQLDAYQSQETDRINAEKEEICDSYEKKVSAETFSKIKEKMSEFSVDALKKEFAFELVQQKPELFNSQEMPIPKPSSTSGLDTILNNYI